MFYLNSHFPNNSLQEQTEKGWEFLSHLVNTPQNIIAGFSKYANDFIIPFMLATNYFAEVERRRILKSSPMEVFQAYMELFQLNFDLFKRGTKSSLEAIRNYNKWETEMAYAALVNTVFGLKGENVFDFIARQSNLASIISEEYPKAIKEVQAEYGFHFERDSQAKIAETDRYILYRVAPVAKDVVTDPAKKPILLIPPYVLGANILAFLPQQNRSYSHCFANEGIPTYVRIMKDIDTTEAVQKLTCEDDTRDTKHFCEVIKNRHGKSVTLNGYCQGGFSALCNILSGELDGLVDALITCVSPMDGTKSHGLVKFLNSLPARFNDLAYGTKKLPNGNKVADGRIMGWVYKLKSIESESPIVAFYRDLMMFSRQGRSQKPKIGKSAAAINYWLNYERNDLPLSITEMSFKSYNIPITEDGTLPVTLFGQKLNLKRMTQKGIPWLICYGINDDLVEKETALAPLDYVSAEVAAFPKGHVAIATSWSLPTSECSLNSCFGESFRGPVRYQLDLNQKLDNEIKARQSKQAAKAKKKQISGSAEPANSGDPAVSSETTDATEAPRKG
jgi:hypothetical protein